MQNVSHSIYELARHDESAPTVHVISDSLGDTAADVALAAASQFKEGAIHIERLPKAQSVDQVKRFLDQSAARDSLLQSQERDLLVFHTIADPVLRAEVVWELERRGAVIIDLLGPAIDAISHITNLTPSGKSGVIRRTDSRYFRRIEAMEFSVNHDDGRNPEGLTEADIVLIGVSRTSKTPLSMYLAFQGIKVAKIPLASGVNPPDELFQCESWRVFGLLSTTEVLRDIRTRRLGSGQALSVAGSYATPDHIDAELAEARALMKRLGCIVIHTNNRAVEETAQEILRYFEMAEEARLCRL